MRPDGEGTNWGGGSGNLRGSDTPPPAPAPTAPIGGGFSPTAGYGLGGSAEGPMNLTGRLGGMGRETLAYGNNPLYSPERTASNQTRGNTPMGPWDRFGVTPGQAQGPSPLERMRAMQAQRAALGQYFSQRGMGALAGYMANSGMRQPFGPPTGVPPGQGSPWANAVAQQPPPPQPPPARNGNLGFIPPGVMGLAPYMGG